MRRIRTVAVAVVLVAALAAVSIITPASGVSTGKLSKQVKQLKKRVAAIQKQQGPAGTAGTARAYATVIPSCPGGPPGVCTFNKSKGISSVTRTGVSYCITAPGIDPATTSAVVSVNWDSTGSPEETAVVRTGGGQPSCAGFQARTERSDPTAATNVSFTILIP